MLNLTKDQQDAAQELATASVAALKVEGGIHPGTVVAATARMAGTYLFRSFGFELPGLEPGQAVLSEQANAGTSALIQTAVGLLSMIGIKLDNSKAGKPVEPQHMPMLPFLETQRKLEEAYLPIISSRRFTMTEAAYAATGAVALLILHCSSGLDPNTAFNLAAYGIIEGAKTAPDPVVLPAA